MSNPSNAAATVLDVEHLLGPLNSDMSMAIMALGPTVRDIEEAALHLSGEGETLPSRQQPHGIVLAILELVDRDEDDSRTR